MAIKKQVKKGGMKTSTALEIGAGLAAVGAGAYYFLGKDGKKHQKQIVKFAKDTKGKIEKKVKPVVTKIKSEVNKSVKSIKANPSVKNIKKEVKKAVATAKKTAKKITK